MGPVVVLALGRADALVPTVADAVKVWMWTGDSPCDMVLARAERRLEGDEVGEGTLPGDPSGAAGTYIAFVVGLKLIGSLRSASASRNVSF